MQSAPLPSDRYQSVQNWQFTQADQQAQTLLNTLVKEAKQNLPQTIYSPYVLTHLKQIKKQSLYQQMKTIPKAVLHHCHIDCNQDQEFYRLYIINDPIIYLSGSLLQFKIGTKQQAQQEGWLSMEEMRKTCKTEQQLVEFISNITMLNQQENRQIASRKVKFWDIFQQKISAFFPILYSLKHFKLYLRHVFKKYIANGYDRLQFRSMLSEISEYDEAGNLVKKHPYRKFAQVIDEVYRQVKTEHSQFSIGIIFFGLKMLSPQQNQAIFRNVCDLNWDKTIGLDVVQQQDPWGSLQPYDKVIDKVLTDYPKLDYKKVYHAGQTKHPDNNNIQIAVKGSSVRIGHGINIIQRLQFIKSCTNICFQISPISNILTGLRDDTRISSAPIIMSLGYPLTINPDDPGKFGYEDTAVDYFSCMISYNWELKDLKLLGYHSINHSICSATQKMNLNKSYNERWNAWVHLLLKIANQ